MAGPSWLLRYLAAPLLSVLHLARTSLHWLQRRYDAMLDLQGLPGRSQLRLLRSGCMDALQSLPGPLNCLNDDFLREQVPRLQSGLHALQWKVFSLETSHSQPRTPYLSLSDCIQRATSCVLVLQGFRASSEARKAVIDIGTSIRCFLAPTWPLGTTALQLLNSDPLFFKVCNACISRPFPLHSSVGAQVVLPQNISPSPSECILSCAGVIWV